MKAFKFTYHKSSSVSKAKRVLDIFKLNPDLVVDLRQCKTIFDEYYDDYVSLSAISTIISRIWKKKLLLRTPTQLASGYFYTFNNKELLVKTYNKHLLPYEFKDKKSIIQEILRSDFESLSCDYELDIERIKDFNFVKKYGVDYFRKKEVQEFLAVNVGFLMCDGHIRANKQQTVFYFRYKEDAAKYKKLFEKFFPNEKLVLNFRRFCYRVYLCSAPFSEFMSFLGAPIGNKLLKSFNVPSWIYYGSKYVKKAFLSTVIGNEGSAPKDNRWRIQFVLSKCKNEVPNLLFFINQVRSMLTYFNISTSHIQLRKQSGNRQFCARFYIKGKENLLKFYNLLGFSYAFEKQKILEDLLRRHNYIK